ncbi:hypothetical protein LB506_007913 [Fusarium annulatum]|nr:hypothetical protein LB506_007913 [Fusarium annulatum]
MACFCYTPVQKKEYRDHIICVRSLKFNLRHLYRGGKKPPFPSKDSPATVVEIARRHGQACHRLCIVFHGGNRNRVRRSWI